MPIYDANMSEVQLRSEVAKGPFPTLFTGKESCRATPQHPRGTQLQQGCINEKANPFLTCKLSKYELIKINTHHFKNGKIYCESPSKANGREFLSRTGHGEACPLAEGRFREGFKVHFLAVKCR